MPAKSSTAEIMSAAETAKTPVSYMPGVSSIPII